MLVVKMVIPGCPTPTVDVGGTVDCIGYCGRCPSKASTAPTSVVGIARIRDVARNPEDGIDVM